jgi:hypothetical protein
MCLRAFVKVPVVLFLSCFRDNSGIMPHRANLCQPDRHSPDISYKPLSALGPAIYCGCFAHGIPYTVAIPLCEISRHSINYFLRCMKDAQSP